MSRVSEKQERKHVQHVQEFPEATEEQPEQQEQVEYTNWATQVREIALKWSPAFRMTILLSIALISILIRVFSVIRYESIIHEFDPWFNYRTTQYLAKEGPYSLWNWYDSESWYPLGRSVGGTVYPGLMTTSGFIYWVLHQLSIPIDIRNVCVFIAPIFSALTSVAAYLMTKEITKRSEAGLLSALFLAIVPSYMSRSVAGSYDNEGVSIFALVFSFYTFLKAVNTGSILWGLYASLAFFYMVASWGGYAFIINIIPIFVAFLIITDRFNSRVYVAYNVFYILGTLLAMQIQFVGFQAIHSSEHMASHGVFILIHFLNFFKWIRKFVTQRGIMLLARFFLGVLITAMVVGLVGLYLAGKTQWSGRSLTLLDPTYAKKYIPIIASVSEHQATTWSSFFFDLHFLVLFTPVGLYYCFKTPTHGKLFMAIYTVFAVYFASVMVRLLLVLAPAVSIMAGIGISWTIKLFTKSIREFFIKNEEEIEQLTSEQTVQPKKQKKRKVRVPPECALLGLIVLGYFCGTYILHANFAGSEAYASPSIILSHKDNKGTRFIIDDFREAYYWLRMNTKQDDKIMSWWDYGYQITGMSNRTVLVDNNTWNNTHIATVGMAMASSEEDAFEICEKLDVDYVLVIFGGMIAYSGDDINKFLWMVRIGGGVYPHIKEEDYYGNGQYRTDSQASETMLNSLMYKLSYYKFDEVQTMYGQPKGYDTVRQYVMGAKNLKLNHFEEAYTSENWIVRIFRRKPRANRDGVSFTSKYTIGYSSRQDERNINDILTSNKYSVKANSKKRRTLKDQD